MDKKDSESGGGRPRNEENGRYQINEKHENGVDAIPDPDAGLSAEEKAAIVRITN